MIQEYNKFSTYIIYYNELSNSLLAKLVGRNYVSVFLPNILSMQYIYIYIFIYIYCDVVFFGQVYSGWRRIWQEMRPESFQKHYALCDGLKESCIINFQLF